MDRAAKEAATDDVARVMGEASFVLVARFEGMSVSAMTRLRRAAGEGGASMRVVKNTLARRGLTKARGLEEDDGEAAELFRGSCAMFWSDEVTAPASVVKKYMDLEGEECTVEPVGGWFEGRRVDAVYVEKLARTPSLEVSRAKTAGLLSAPAAKLAGLAGRPGALLASVLRIRGTKEELIDG